MIDIKGKVAILTGAAEGWGYEIAKAYIRAGIKVALMDVQAEKLQRLADEIKVMRAAGFTDLTVEQLIYLKEHGE